MKWHIAGKTELLYMNIVEQLIKSSFLDNLNQ